MSKIEVLIKKKSMPSFISISEILLKLYASISSIDIPKLQLCYDFENKILFLFLFKKNRVVLKNKFC